MGDKDKDRDDMQSEPTADENEESIKCLQQTIQRWDALDRRMKKISSQIPTNGLNQAKKPEST